MDLDEDLPAGYIKPGDPKARPCALCEKIVADTYRLRCAECWMATQHVGRIAFAVYDHPEDHPDKFVVRRYLLEIEGSEPTEHRLWTFDTLAEARAKVPPFMRLVPRDLLDRPGILETWV